MNLRPALIIGAFIFVGTLAGGLVGATAANPGDRVQVYACANSNGTVTRLRHDKPPRCRRNSAPIEITWTVPYPEEFAPIPGDIVDPES